jgi:hypothetical protein
MPPQDTEIKQQVRQRFANVARSPKSEQVFPVGPDSAKALGYDSNEIDGLPAEVTESFSGVGNPLSLGDIENGQTVLDLGCGAGLDSILAARRVANGHGHWHRHDDGDAGQGKAECRLRRCVCSAHECEAFRKRYNDGVSVVI